jgi:hypothetical protein
LCEPNEKRKTKDEVYAMILTKIMMISPVTVFERLPTFPVIFIGAKLNNLKGPTGIVSPTAILIVPLIFLLISPKIAPFTEISQGTFV